VNRDSGTASANGGWVNTQRSIGVKYDDSKERYSIRKLIPVNPKTLGDHLLLKRIEANLTQPEVAQNARVSVRTVRQWEHGRVCPTEHYWQALTGILNLGAAFIYSQNQSPE
jgi:DNA-binding transcriptional regulator YiaG